MELRGRTPHERGLNSSELAVEVFILAAAASLLVCPLVCGQDRKLSTGPGTGKVSGGRRKIVRRPSYKMETVGPGLVALFLSVGSQRGTA